MLHLFIGIDPLFTSSLISMLMISTTVTTIDWNCKLNATKKYFVFILRSLGSISTQGIYIFNLHYKQSVRLATRVMKAFSV